MTYNVIIGPQAEADLMAIYTFIRNERQEPTVAISYLRRIRSFCEGLADFPERGRKRDDIRAGLRLVGFERRVVIAFKISGQAIDIRRIFYGGQDFETILADGE